MKERTRVDPLRLCVFSTVALLTWLIGAPVVAVMSGLGLRAYARSWREGARRSRCVLGDVRIVLAYLSVIFVASSAWTVWSALRLLR